MANGTVKIFNCTPFTVELSINGVNTLAPLSPMEGAPVASALFSRIDQDNIPHTAAFATNNTLDTRSEDMPNISYRVPIPAADYPLDANLVIYIFNRGAFLSYQGKAFPLNPA